MKATVNEHPTCMAEGWSTRHIQKATAPVVRSPLHRIGQCKWKLILLYNI